MITNGFPTRAASVFSIALSLLVGATPLAAQSLAASATCTTCPARVPDGGAAAAPAQFLVSAAPLAAASCGGAAPAGGVDVRVDLLHNHVGDLRLRLIAPDNTAFTLLDRLPDGTLTCAGEDIVGNFVVAVDGAAAPVCQVRIPAVGGLVQPSGALAGLAGAPVVGGNWSLEVGDYADAGEGLLRSWQFTVYCERYGLFFRGDFED